MVNLTQFTRQLNQSKLGLYFIFDCNEEEETIYIVKASEATFDSELDDHIGHLARFNTKRDGDFRGWICVNAVSKIQSLMSALQRYWRFKQTSLNAISITIN